MNSYEVQINDEIYTILDDMVIVQMDKPKENIRKTASGLYIAENVESQKRDPSDPNAYLENGFQYKNKDRLETASETGVLAAIGSAAFYDFPEPHPQIGDRVMFNRYVGSHEINRKNVDADTNTWFRIMNDKDIHCVIRKADK